MLQELGVERTWNVEEHPLWLVFEAEGQLQIRPKQHYVAQQLIDNYKNGPILQLNMGEGKTRVILPMLVLHWAAGKDLVSQTAQLRRCPPTIAAALLPLALIADAL